MICRDSTRYDYWYDMVKHYLKHRDEELKAVGYSKPCMVVNMGKELHKLQDILSPEKSRKVLSIPNPDYNTARDVSTFDPRVAMS